ncbi:hypothetical protein NN6n1_01300 [Shinella zoogloeoides]
MVYAYVARDREDPGRDTRAFGIKIGRLAPNGQHRFLDKILRSGGRHRPAQEEGLQLRPEVAEEKGKSLTVSGLRDLHHHFDKGIGRGRRLFVP